MASPASWLGVIIQAGSLFSLGAPAGAATNPAASSSSPSSATAPGPITVAWQPEATATNRWTVEARGLSDATWAALRKTKWSDQDWQKVFPVIAETGNLGTDVGLPPMVGRYEIAGRRVRFRPRYPLQPGVSYHATLRLAALPGGVSGASSVSASFRAPVPKRIPRTVVSNVFPSADVLPENLLKFYLQFSGPMSGGHIYDHIHLLNESNRPVELPFLEIDEELWDPTMTRLTLFIDPGRIKRGVTPLEEIGPALENGRRYTLAIDAAWPDASGAPMKTGFRKSFLVNPPNRTPIAAHEWKIQAPGTGTLDPVVVRFDRPMDWALARRIITIWRLGESSGTRPNREAVVVKGTAELEEQERVWRFTPERAWPHGPFELRVQNTLEDLSGNNIGKSFEVDLFEGVQRRVTNAVVRLPFEVK